jgi:colanic acid/amylovoran biosynthesis glycosyltransferase
MKPFVVFRRRILPISETFIPQQADHVPGYVPLYAGVERDNAGQFAFPDARLMSDTASRLARLRFDITGFPPARWLGGIADAKPFLVHAHFGPDGTDAMRVARALSIPLIVTFHGFDITISRLPLPNKRFALYLARRQRLFSNAACVIAVSDFIRQRLIDAGCDASKVVRHYIGVDVDTFTATGAPREAIILFVGRLVEKKGCIHMLRAVAARDELRSCAIVIIGDGPERMALERYASDNSINARFLGARPLDVIKTWMDRARVLCVPSITARNGDSEAFGMVFAEAQSMGLPVASFRSGGVPEAVEDNVTGLLAQEGDTAALAANLVRILGDEMLWQKMSAAGRHRVLTMFDLKEQCRRLRDLYDDIIT